MHIKYNLFCIRETSDSDEDTYGDKLYKSYAKANKVCHKKEKVHAECAEAHGIDPYIKYDVFIVDIRALLSDHFNV